MLRNAPRATMRATQPTNSSKSGSRRGKTHGRHVIGARQADFKSGSHPGRLASCIYQRPVGRGAPAPEAAVRPAAGAQTRDESRMCQSYPRAGAPLPRGCSW